VYAPSDFAGDLMGDLNGRRGRIGGMDTRGVTTVIKAQVPMSEAGTQIKDTLPLGFAATVVVSSTTRKAPIQTSG